MILSAEDLYKKQKKLITERDWKTSIKIIHQNAECDQNSKHRHGLQAKSLSELR